MRFTEEANADAEEMPDSLPDGTDGLMAHEVGSDAIIGPAAGMENKSSRPESGSKV